MWHMSIDVSKLRIIHYPDPILKQKAEPIESVDESVRAVAQRMFELMRGAEGVGLAAPQVGLSWQMFVMAGDAESGRPEMVFINPTLSVTNRELAVREEGCLSIPGVHVEVRRPSGIEISATTLNGDSFTMRDEDFLARVWQHEADHLDGVLIIDRMSPMDRLATRKALKELRAAAGVK
jgi:peptide deformylase